MIKKYKEYIKESYYKGFDSVGEYIESLSKGDEYILNIISNYTQDIDPTIRISNAINLLDKETQNTILKLIEDYRNRTEKEEDPDITAYVDANLLESNQILGGKNLFKCFLKVITALGQKNINIDFKSYSDNFIFLYKTLELPVNDVKSVMSRYQYFDQFISSLDYTQNECQLYYGITSKLDFQYGIMNDTQVIPFGQIKITKGVVNYLLTLSSPSLVNMKMNLVNFDINKLILISKIKESMKSFSIGSFDSKKSTMINKDVITFGYYGIGKWDNGKIDENEIENVKSNFRNFLIQFKWSDKVQISVTSNDFWLYLNIKLK